MPVLLAGLAASAVAVVGPPPDRGVRRPVARPVTFVLPAEPHRVGRIILRGNVVTADAAVLAVAGVRSGQTMPGEADLLRAEIRLLMAFPTRFDLANGRRPTVTVRRSPGSTVHDLEVHFPERPE